jgi:hypothetical protein
MNRAQVVIKAVAIAVLQFVLANIVTLLLSFPVNMQPEENPWGVAAVLMVTSLIGITLGGWLGLRINWLPGSPTLPVRIAGAAAGVVVLLGLALILGQMRQASPFLTGSMLVGIVGFHLPGWFGGSDTGAPGPS